MRIEEKEMMLESIRGNEEEVERQHKALRFLAEKVMSNFDKMQIGEIINRIHYLSGRSIVESIQGYKLLRATEYIPDIFVDQIELEERYLNAIKSPVIQDTINRFGCVLHKFSDYRAYEIAPAELFDARKLLEGLKLTVDF